MADNEHDLPDSHEYDAPPDPADTEGPMTPPPPQPRRIPIADPMIPGERDPSNLTHREPGAVSGQFAGADIPPDPAPWIDEHARIELVREGGGIDAERHLRQKSKQLEKSRQTE